MLKLIRDSRVYLYPRYTLLYEEAISGLSLIVKDNRDSSKTNLATGVSGQYRYLGIERDSYIDATKIRDVMLLRGKQGIPEGWDGMFDLNKSRKGDFLYLVWSTTTFLPHRFIKDIVVCSFNLSIDYLYFIELLYRLNTFPPRRRQNLGILKRKTIFLRTSTRDLAASKFKWFG